MNARGSTFRHVGALLLTAAALSSCRTLKFYTQAAHGQFEVMAKARPISQVRARPDTDSRLRQQLALVDALRTYAGDVLKLPTDKQFRSYADLGRCYVVWNVYAAPEFSLEARTWTYPLVGKLKYRGFFTEQAAREEALRLKADGFDVAVSGVRVYSTLGWFSDPVLNTFIRDHEAELAETIFHELTHSRFFVGGDTDFNEAYATAAAQLGVRQWLQSKNDHRALARYEHELQMDARVLGLLKATRARLGTQYAKQDTMSAEELRRAKAAVLHDTRLQYGALKRLPHWDGNHDGWVNGNLNNARLASLATYHDLVPAFARLFHAGGDDWEEFHRAVASMKRLDKAARRSRLQALP